MAVSKGFFTRDISFKIRLAVQRLSFYIILTDCNSRFRRVTARIRTNNRALKQN